MPRSLTTVAKEKKLKYFLISFVDLFGVLRAKLVPAQAISAMQRDGAGFAGFAAWLDMTPADPDVFASRPGQPGHPALEPRDRLGRERPLDTRQARRSLAARHA